MDREIAMDLSFIWGELIYMDQQDEKYGPNSGRARKYTAYTNLLDYMSQDFGPEVAEARFIAEDRARRRAERRENGR